MAGLFNHLLKIGQSPACFIAKQKQISGVKISLGTEHPLRISIDIILKTFYGFLILTINHQAFGSQIRQRIFFAAFYPHTAAQIVDVVQIFRHPVDGHINHLQVVKGSLSFLAARIFVYYLFVGGNGCLCVITVILQQTYLNTCFAGQYIVGKFLHQFFKNR